MNISRSQTPVSPSVAAEEAFRPTQAHQLTPYSSPRALSGKQRISLDVSALYLPSLCNEDEVEIPIICYFPTIMSRRVSCGSCVPAESSWDWGDGDVTPPLSPKPSIQVVSPAADRYKRKRQDEEEEEEGIVVNNSSNNNRKTARLPCPTSLWQASLESPLAQHQQNQKNSKPQELPMIPNFPGVSRSSADQDIQGTILGNCGSHKQFVANTLEQAAASLALPLSFTSNHLNKCLRPEPRKSTS